MTTVAEAIKDLERKIANVRAAIAALDPDPEYGNENLIEAWYDKLESLNDRLDEAKRCQYKMERDERDRLSDPQ